MGLRNNDHKRRAPEGKDGKDVPSSPSRFGNRTFRLRRLVPAAGALILVPFGLFFLLNALFPFPEHRLHPAPSTVVEARDGIRMREFLPPDQTRRTPITLDQVPEILIRTLTASEDQRFFGHPGVDPLAVLRAAWSNLKAGEVVSGASTIPMQIARMADPRPRTIKAKLIESFRALQLNLLFSKTELLEIYLNLLPMGSNTAGVEAGARRMFGKPVSAVSLAEAALLTAVPRAPSQCDPFRNPDIARKLRNRVLAQLAERDAVTSDEAQEAMTRPLPNAPHPPPMLAPHFCRYAAGLHPGAPVIRTTLDRSMQTAAESILAAHARTLRGKGIGNAACVILDVATREVRAMAGSIDFFDAVHAGQVNMALARRSPGSTLKPFLYATAMDRGLVVPDSLISDLPVDYAGYVPENYDGTYSGRVTVREALSRSLNVPAVRLLARTGVPEFLELLHQGGLNTLDRGPETYGLPLVLGACEVRLTDLVNLYADLAAQGRHRDWKVLAEKLPTEKSFSGDRQAGEKQIMSKEAAWLVTRMLMDVERPDLPGSWKLTRDAPTVAWKTGTSFGHRDAWAVGVTGDLAFGVWVGNPDGTPIKGISGARNAGPLLFDLIRAAAHDPAPLLEPPGTDLESMEVCAADRLLPSPLCPERMKITVISGVTRLQPSTAHVRVFVDDETGLRLAGSCLESRPHHARTFEILPPELAAWRASLGMLDPDASPPALHPSCRDAEAAGVAEGTVRIISPNPATPYRLRRDAPPEFQKIALIGETVDGSDLHWYADGKYLGKSAPDTPLFLTPNPGRHRVTAMTEEGATAGVNFRVAGGK